MVWRGIDRSAYKLAANDGERRRDVRRLTCSILSRMSVLWTDRLGVS